MATTSSRRHRLSMQLGRALLAGVVAACAFPSAGAASDRRAFVAQAAWLRLQGRLGPDLQDAPLRPALLQACQSEHALLRRGAAQGLLWWPQPKQAIPPLRQLEAAWHDEHWRSDDANAGRYVTRTALAVQTARDTGLGGLDTAVDAFLKVCKVGRTTLRSASADSGMLRVHWEYALYLQGLAIVLGDATGKAPAGTIGELREAFRFDLVPAAMLRIELAPLAGEQRRALLLDRLDQAAVASIRERLAAQALADEGLRDPAVQRLVAARLRDIGLSPAASVRWRICLYLAVLGAVGDSAMLPVVRAYLEHPDAYIRRRAGLIADALATGRPYPAATEYL